MDDLKNKENLAQFIDHTLLKPDATKADIEQLCKDAVQYHFAAVCVPPFWVSYCHEMLESLDVKVATVVGFPLGYNATAVKVEECKKAIIDGADEIDFVVNISALKSGNVKHVQSDINAVCSYCHMKNKKVKMIIEIGLLNETEIKTLCKMAVEEKVDYVKTSTGMLSRGVEVDDIKLLRSLLPKDILIKASGGIKIAPFAQELVVAGASRLGTSSSVAIISES